MRLVCVVSGFLDVLARWLALHRSLEQQGQESLEWLRMRDGKTRFAKSRASYTLASAVLEREIEDVTAALSDTKGVTDAEFEACLPQVTRLLLDFAPRPPTSFKRREFMAYDPRSREYLSYSTTTISSDGEANEPSAGEALTQRLREALVSRCSRSSQLGLEACWLLQDAIASRGAATMTYDSWGAQVARECWRATAGVRDEARDSAALIASLVRVSEALAKVDRNKRRDKARLLPLLEAMNAWLAPRASGPRRGVRLPLCPLSSDRQVRVLRLDVDNCQVMPSRARAPTLVYCEALVLAEEDPVFNLPTANSGASSLSINTIAAPSCDVVRTSQTLRGPGAAAARRLVSSVYAPSVWEAREDELRRTSKYGSLPGWRLTSFLIKADDELRREMLAMQFVRLLRDILLEAHVDVWLRPYAVICAGRRAGLVETLADAKSVTHLKSHLTELHGTTTLATYFDVAYGGSVYDSQARRQAALNFAKSLAAYSLVCYVLDLKDRHNGNILLDRNGHIIHIDFGYMLGITPGNIRFETAPFKLTDDYVQVMGGFESPAWAHFLHTFAAGLHAIARNFHKCHTLLLLFFGDASPKLREVSLALAERLELVRTDNRAAAYAAAMRLVKQALSSDRTKQYDWYQWKTNGILM